MAIEFQVVSDSGDIVSFYLTGTADGNRVLQKQEIEALITALAGANDNVKADPTDPVTEYLQDKIDVVPPSGVALVPDGAGNYLQLTFTGLKVSPTTVNALSYLWSGTQAEYDLIGTKDPLTLYFIE